MPTQAKNRLLYYCWLDVHTNAVQPAEPITTPQFSASASPVTTPSIIIPNPQSSERLGWDTALYPVNKAGQNQNTPCARRDRSARTPNPWYSGDVRPNNVLQPVEGEEIIQFVTFAIPVKYPDSPSRRDSSSSGYIHSSQTRKEAPNIIPNWERSLPSINGTCHPSPGSEEDYLHNGNDLDVSRPTSPSPLPPSPTIDISSPWMESSRSNNLRMLGDDDTLHLIDGEQHHRLPLVTFPVLQSTHPLAIALPYDVPATSCPQPYPAGQVAGAAPVQSAVVVKIEELTPTPPFSIPASSTVNVNKEMRSAEPQQYQPS
ncbi:hypothetical protein BLNAU_3982 [Blattamonas nauphoetae]|uniref:Uncharacterized protein n=1 Tax=Blattamonas nauphoetae TaxID=2049346 RepID=A0ABQ9YAV2_9EUKA|nr:hypothetical protein BLNAU_3982 [Blattamonas nauphoetae]